MVEADRLGAVAGLVDLEVLAGRVLVEEGCLEVQVCPVVEVARQVWPDLEAQVVGEEHLAVLEVVAVHPVSLEAVAVHPVSQEVAVVLRSWEALVSGRVAAGARLVGQPEE